MPCASSAALSFSQIRGTEPQTVGLTSGRCATTSRGSAIEVTVLPQHDRALVVGAQRSAMWAEGRNEVLRPPGVAGSRATIERTSAIRLAWVSSTPLGGPVVPEV